MIDPILEAAINLGEIHGTHTANALNPTYMTKYSAAIILQGIAEDNEDVLSICPKPLSGEWADDPTPMTILDDIVDLAGEGLNALRGEIIEDDSSDILDAYEEAFTTAFWERLIVLAKAVLAK